MGRLVIFTTRALRGVQSQKYLCRTDEPCPLLVGINISGPLFVLCAHAQVKKKTASPPPIFPKFVLDAAILARKRERGGEGEDEEPPLRYSLFPQIRAMRASRSMNRASIQDLDLCRPALTETLSTPLPTVSFRFAS